MFNEYDKQLNFESKRFCYSGNGSASNTEVITAKVEHNIETVDEGELELVCEAPPAKKKAPMVVDLTLSSSDSEEDDTSLLNIKERLLNLHRASGSQSSRPSTADSIDQPTTGKLLNIINS